MSNMTKEIRRAITEATGFEFDANELQEFNEHDLMRVIDAVTPVIQARLRGEAAPKGLTVADGLIEAAFDDGFIVSKNFPATFLTEEANREMAWTVGRSLPPYCNDAGERQWSGPTAQAAISVARAALGMPTASPAPVAGDAVAKLPEKFRNKADSLKFSGTWPGDYVADFVRDCADALEAALAQDRASQAGAAGGVP